MPTIIIPVELKRQLAMIAGAKHTFMESLVTEILQNYVEDQELYNREKTEDEIRWQRYLKTGESISREVMSRKLQAIANKAATKAN